MKPFLHAVDILLATALVTAAGLALVAAPVRAQTPSAAMQANGAANSAANPAPPRQDPALLREAVMQFLQRQSVGLPGTVTIDVGQVEARLNLPACLQPEPFLGHGARAWGRTTVGIRCTAPAPWTIYVAANVHVMADYLAAATPLVQGQVVGQNDVSRQRGDLTMLPGGVITDPAQAIGRTTVSSLQLGAPLRQDLLRAQPAVQMGQTIRLLSAGPGFKVSSEARAMNNAVEGQTVQAKTPTGQLISGIARAGGVLEVAY
jgi:flagella basal body P-ring formation protein FlgA